MHHAKSTSLQVVRLIAGCAVLASAWRLFSPGFHPLYASEGLLDSSAGIRFTVGLFAVVVAAGLLWSQVIRFAAFCLALAMFAFLPIAFVLRVTGISREAHKIPLTLILFAVTVVFTGSPETSLPAFALSDSVPQPAG